MLPGRNSVSSPSYRFGYQGKFAEKDPETGFDNFELRQYDSKILRWKTKDKYKQHFSPYMSMGNNPMRNIDPNGGWEDEYIIDRNTGERTWVSPLGGEEMDFIHYGYWDESGGFIATSTIITETPQWGGDLGKTGNFIRNKVDSDFEKFAFQRFWNAGGNYYLMVKDFERIIQHAGEVQSETAINQGAIATAKVHSFYTSSDEFDAVLGSATIYYDKDGNAIGFKDTYDFDSRPWLGKSRRPFIAEIQTRSVKQAGLLHGAEPYNIKFGLIPK